MTSTTPAPATPAASTAQSRKMTVTLRVLQVGLTLFFLASAAPKLIGHSSATEVFDRIGFGDWFMYLVATLELAGAMALLIPLLSGLAGMAIIGLMIGAFITTVTALDGENAVTPLLVIIPAAVIARGRREQTARLIGLVRGRP